MLRHAARPLALLLLIAAAAPAVDGETIDRVLAVVGGRVITLSDARATIEFGILQPRPARDAIAEAVDYLVNRELMLAEVDRYSAPAPDSRALDARVGVIRARYPDEASFRRALGRTAFTEGRLRDLLGDNLRIESYLDQRFGAAAQPTPEEVQRYYLDHQAEFTLGGRVRPLEQVQAEAFAKLTSERRNSLIAEWLDRLRRQFPVSSLYTPVQR